ncbi:penicillin-binding protein [Marinobacterium nitratireducens]|uniref:Penicillin-binding protein 1A n=1 Tax=Marinobacterium nitratireducens TaxID=518897 RepID=A0A917Z8S8_9GAMM|nr:penicillin-binding protein 1A [Marinobacterium nitratireducens]GGO78302.1 penicillin-binding protein [Marinobacterium nitratireducens]
MGVFLSLVKFLIKLGLAALVMVLLAAAGVYYTLEPDLPDVETLREIQYQTPLRIYSSDKKLIAEFGEKRRTPVAYESIPTDFIHAFQAAEDSRFFEHIGIDIKGLARAAVQLAASGHIQSGGSTITMQVAKNFFLTRERTFKRKFSEILLALRIERELSKEEIFALYINKIYLGQRAYGIEAAANVYYGASINELTLAQMAMIAGLPKAPSADNPISNPDRALARRNWILQRMHRLGYISDQDHEEASAAPLTARYHGADIELDAPYIAEMVRSQLFEQYGDDLYNNGFRVYTTISSERQEAANRALRQGLLAYSKRHGYHGPESQLDTAPTPELIASTLDGSTSYSGLQPAIVTAVHDKSVEAALKSGDTATVEWSGLEWARPYRSHNSLGPAPKKAADILAVGDVIRLSETEGGWELTQLPRVQGAFVALDPKDGAIQALTGGFNFSLNKFNRATQAYRQPGSNFKPFIYAAALENGFTPASLINDAPIVYHDTSLDKLWRPENYSRRFYGPTRLREGLYKSRNLVSIRLLRAVGIKTTIDYVSRFGFPLERLPRNLSLSLGTADLTPLEVAQGYAALANGGYRVEPYLIGRIDDPQGNLIHQATVPQICADCPTEQTMTDSRLAPRIMDSRTAYQMYSMLQDVIRQGTGTRAQSLDRSDLAGKTGTTNDQKDAWFSGFNRNLVATTWVGFDQPKPLGRREFGSSAALPIWIDFMQTALNGMPEEAPSPPDGIVRVRIDPSSGLLARPGQENAIFEVFRSEDAPTQYSQGTAGNDRSRGLTTEDIF